MTVTPTTSTTGLEVRDLTVRTSSGRVLLDHVSWHVAPGERLGVIGESGSGKSLTSLAIMGLLPDRATRTGTVCLDGDDLTAMSEAQLRRVRGDRVAMIFQDPLSSLNPY